MEFIEKYFPQLTNKQTDQFRSLQGIYADWNSRINLISRKDIDHLYERHVLHSLAIAKFILLPESTKVLDVGTGGGFPGIPLAILFPEVEFHLVDSKRKKMDAVQHIAEDLQLTNVNTSQARVEEMKGKYDFITARAVTSLLTFYQWTNKLLASNGAILYLRGGDIQDDLKLIPMKSKVVNLNEYFEEAFFESKLLVCLY